MAVSSVADLPQGPHMKGRAPLPRGSVRMPPEWRGMKAAPAKLLGPVHGQTRLHVLRARPTEVVAVA